MFVMRAARRGATLAMSLLVFSVIVGCSKSSPPTVADEVLGKRLPAGTEPAPKPEAEAGGGAPEGDGWVSLFDGKTLDGWESTKFGGEGEVMVEDGHIHIGFGSNASGITWTKPDMLPRMNYEISLEAMRYDGNDFFCGLTFPVGEDYCSLICGGWGGGVTGLSSLDRFDASENSTSQWINYKNKQWYKIRVRVTKTNISAWMDGKKIIDVDTEGVAISTRPEVDLSKPLGVATWVTSACLRNIYVRPLPE